MNNPLSYEMQLTAKVLERVCDQKQSLPNALNAVCLASRANNVRGAVQDLSYLSMRQLAAAEAILISLMPRQPATPLRYLLIVALVLLLDQKKRYMEFTVVNQAVEAASQLRLHAANAVTNGVLRNFLRQRNELTQKLASAPNTLWNFPLWWIEALRTAYANEWEHILTISNQPPPMSLRVNQVKIEPSHALEMLATQAIHATSLGTTALRLDKPLPVTQLPGFAQGLLSVQDAGAQRAVPLLDIKNGMRVLDACAAPGGKTGHLLETAAVEVYALEIDAERAQRIKENLARLPCYAGAQAHIIVDDASTPERWWNGQPFDRILIDAPCSASGIVRRHPDIRWLRRAEDIKNLVAQQRALLCALWPLLAVGGKLLYATCSIFPQEGEMQAQWFEKTQKDAVRLQAPGQILPDVVTSKEGRLLDDHDGFYYALFEKCLPH